MYPLEFYVPYPPSVNHYLGRGRRGHSYTLPKTELFQQKIRQITKGFAPINKFFKIDVLIYPPDRNKKRDTANIEKVLLDAFQYAGFVSDDVLNDNITLHRARNEKGEVLIIKEGMCLVTIDMLYEYGSTFTFSPMEGKGSDYYTLR